jgi:hypothetical protein
MNQLPPGRGGCARRLRPPRGAAQHTQWPAWGPDCPGAHHRVTAPGPPGLRRRLGRARGGLSCCTPSALCSATSPAGKASGQRSARMAMYCAVQSPMPGRPSARPRGRHIGAAVQCSAVVHRARQGHDGRLALLARCPVGPARRLLACASTAGAGNRREQLRATGVSMGSPKRSTSRCASVRAAATVICWPSTARTASSKPSSVPGTRRPSPCGKAPCSTALMACRVGVQVERGAHAADHQRQHLAAGRR